MAVYCLCTVRTAIHVIQIRFVNFILQWPFEKNTEAELPIENIVLLFYPGDIRRIEKPWQQGEYIYG